MQKKEIKERRRLILSKNQQKDMGQSFEEQFKRSTSPMLTLLLLSEKPMYVYNLSQELSRRSNSAYKMSFLYPVLYKLQQQGYVTEYSQEVTESHRTRNYYAITDNGRRYLKLLQAKYRELLFAVDTILNYDEDKKTDIVNSC